MKLWDNIKSSASNLFGSKGKVVKTIKSTIHNVHAITSAGSLVGTGGVAVANKIQGSPITAIAGIAVAPALAAMTAVDLTVGGAEFLTNKLFPGTKVEKIEEGEFKKESAIGKGAEQFLQGDISGNIDDFLSFITGATEAVASKEKKEIEKEKKEIIKDGVDYAKENAVELINKKNASNANTNP